MNALRKRNGRLAVLIFVIQILLWAASGIPKIRELVHGFIEHDTPIVVSLRVSLLIAIAGLLSAAFSFAASQINSGDPQEMEKYKFAAGAAHIVWIVTSIVIIGMVVEFFSSDKHGKVTGLLSSGAIMGVLIFLGSLATKLPDFLTKLADTSEQASEESKKTSSPSFKS